jgi:flagellar motor switch protein FliM
VPPVAAHGLVNRTGMQEPLALAIDGAAMLRLIDRAFGGPGEVPLPLPSTLPPSATLVVGRVAAAIGAALADTLDCAAEELVFQPRGEAPDAIGAAALTLLVSQGSDPAWPIALALSPGGLAEWLGPRRVEAAARRSADPAAAPFADVPLPLAARLVDMRVPLSTVARIEPGMVLPVAIARAVPLEAGGVVIARGTVGNQDDRIAIKLTNIA